MASRRIDAREGDAAITPGVRQKQKFAAVRTKGRFGAGSGLAGFGCRCADSRRSAADPISAFHAFPRGVTASSPVAGAAMASGVESRSRKLTLATAGERPSVLPSTNLGRGPRGRAFTSEFPVFRAAVSDADGSCFSPDRLSRSHPRVRSFHQYSGPLRRPPVES